MSIERLTEDQIFGELSGVGSLSTWASCYIIPPDALISPFRPGLDMHDAYRVAEQLRSEGYCVDVEGTRHEYLVIVKPPHELAGGQAQDRLNRVIRRASDLSKLPAELTKSCLVAKLRAAKLEKAASDLKRLGESVR